MKLDKKLQKAFNTCGFEMGDIKTKSDFDLMLADNRNVIVQCNVTMELLADIKEQAKIQVEHLEDIDNEYEKEILRSLNPNRTIY